MHTALEFFSRFFRQEKQAGQSRAEELYILPGILGALLSPHPLKMQREAQSRGRRAAGKTCACPGSITDPLCSLGKLLSVLCLSSPLGSAVRATDFLITALLFRSNRGS